jgi:hypothetical protein
VIGDPKKTGVDCLQEDDNVADQTACAAAIQTLKFRKGVSCSTALGQGQLPIDPLYFTGVFFWVQVGYPLTINLYQFSRNPGIKRVLIEPVLPVVC